jgi:hypothetical protein
MTEDTKRALEIIQPIAKELNINVSADGHCLYCNGQAIGIACNSTYATLNEFLGYAMLWMFLRNPGRWRGLPSGFEKQVKEYWIDSETLKKWRKAWEEEDHD